MARISTLLQKQTDSSIPLSRLVKSQANAFSSRIPPSSSPHTICSLAPFFVPHVVIWAMRCSLLATDRKWIFAARRNRIRRRWQASKGENEETAKDDGKKKEEKERLLDWTPDTRYFTSHWRRLDLFARQLFHLNGRPICFPTDESNFQRGETDFLSCTRWSLV